MKMAHLKNLKQAEEAVNAVLLLTHAKIGAKTAGKTPNVDTHAARKQRKSAGAVQLDDYERDERLFEIGEVEGDSFEGEWIIPRTPSIRHPCGRAVSSSRDYQRRTMESSNAEMC